MTKITSIGLFARQGMCTFVFRPRTCINNINKVHFVDLLGFKDSIDTVILPKTLNRLSENIKSYFLSATPRFWPAVWYAWQMHTKKKHGHLLSVDWALGTSRVFTVGSEKMKGFRLFWACVYPDQMSGAVSVWLVPPDNAEPCQTSFLVIVAASIDCTLHFTNQYGLGECHRHLSGVQPQILKTQWWGGTVCLSVNHQNAGLSSFSRCLTLYVFLYFRSVPCRQLSLHKLSSI